MMIFSLTPGLLYIIGGVISFFTRGILQKLVVLAIPVLAFFQIINLVETDTFTINFLMHQIDLLRVDKISLVFAYVFVISSFAAFLFGIATAKKLEYSSALIYIGSALSVIFARDVISLYIFWELMALSSVMLVLLRGTLTSRKSAVRYISVHIIGGLILLAGIIMYMHSTGSIEFSSFNIKSAATWLILTGFLVNAAAIPFTSWLPDAYPNATVMGGIILSAYTTKTAVYTLLRGFTGWDVLIWMGAAMAIYGAIYALLENDIRRILSYSIINQVGFKVCAIGIGTKLAIAGACAHVFCGVIYNSLLWMQAGAVMQQTGTSKCTELGGLYRRMPWTFILGTIGALAISSVPFTSGFTSKTIILKAAALDQQFWPWLLLEIGSVAVILFVGLKYIYFVFFGKDRNLEVQEANIPMRLSMGIMAFLCIFLGCFPKVLYELGPYSEYVMKKIPYMFSAIYFENIAKLVTKLQLLSMTTLAFFICLPMLKKTNTISIEIDWLYRRGLRYVYIFMIAIIDFIYNTINKISMDFIRSISSFLLKSIPTMMYIVNLPYLRISRVPFTKKQLMENYTTTLTKSAIPFSALGISVFILFIILYLIT